MLGVCIAGTVQAYVHRLGLAPLVPEVAEDLRLSYAAAGTLVTAYFWPYVAVQVPMGVLTDRVGARRTMLMSLAVLGVGIAAFSVSQTYGQSIAARVVVGLGAAGFWLPSLRLIAEWFPVTERGRAIGLCSAGGGAGATAALLVLPIVSGWLGWRWAYATTLVPAAVMLVLAGGILGRRPTHGDGSAAARRERLRLREALRYPVLWALCGASLCSYGAFLGVVSWLPTFLVERERFTASAAGLTVALITAGTTVSWPVAGLLADRVAVRKLVYVVSHVLGALACVTIAVLVPGAGVSVALATSLAMGLVLGGMVVPFVILADVLPMSLVGTASGVLNTFWLVGGLLAPIMLGALLDATRSFTLVFLVCAALELLAVLAIAFLPARSIAGARVPLGA